MTNNRNFCVSGSIFGEFKTSINLDLTESNDDIIKIVINRIHNDIQNYPQLIKELDKKKETFHIHDINFGDILISDSEKIFYVCSHCSV
jgi:hypothetical protein